MGRHHDKRKKSRSNSFSDEKQKRRDLEKEKRKSKWSDKPPSDQKQNVDQKNPKFTNKNDPAIQYIQNQQMNNPNIIKQQINFKYGEKDPGTIQSFLKQAQASSGYATTYGINLNDPTKIKRKVYMPTHQNFNYSGLIIGPKGANQKRLEEETGCKILVRGKGSQKESSLPQPDDDEDQHVLIMGDNEQQVNDAASKIERILFAEEDIRNNIRQEQLKVVASLKNCEALGVSGQVDLSLTTPYGPPSTDAYIIPIPNDCVGLVIGKQGETIRQIQLQSGATKVQVAADSAQQSDTRNVFVEGDQEAIEKVKNLLQNIIETQQKLKFAKTGQSSQSLQSKHELVVPNNLVGLVIGRKGETIKSIIQRSGAYIYIPPECEKNRPNERLLTISGVQGAVDIAMKEIQTIIDMGMQNQMNKEALVKENYMQQPYQPQMPYMPQQMQNFPQQPTSQVIPQQIPQTGDNPGQQNNPYLAQQQSIEQATLLYLQQLYNSQQNIITETIIETDPNENHY